ncbi:MAG: hypothetical protein HC780_24885 [Leptolyngbyaceae cyanobacterium CSU_1_3]|nr:hypothetical protein [Leptolyngbyaceae cyanobacterium CSU_1_3]
MPSTARLSRPHPSPLPTWEREQESGSPSLKLGEGLGDEGENLGIHKSTFLSVDASGGGHSNAILLPEEGQTN